MLKRSANRNARCWTSALKWSIPAAVLATGFYMRAADLSTVQHFAGDQGRDYLVIMDWVQRGRWPLLGPQRITGDYTIGPGWFYVVAPAMVLSGFHPAAGALTMAIFGTAAALIAALWVWRTTRSYFGGLLLCIMFSWTAGWIERDRMLWNPTILPFGVIAWTFLLDEIRRHPLPAATLSGLVLIVLPQWQSAAFLAVVPGRPFWGLALWKSRHRLKQAPFGRKLVWGGVAAGVILLHYGPPLIYEFHHGPGNLSHYIANTIRMMPKDSSASSMPSMQSAGLLEFFHEVLYVSPVRWLEKLPLVLRWCVAILSAVVMWMGVRRHTHPRPSLTLGPFYLVSLMAIALTTAVVRGPAFLSYFWAPALPAPFLLLGWAISAFLKSASHPRFENAAPAGTSFDSDSDGIDPAPTIKGKLNGFIAGWFARGIAVTVLFLVLYQLPDAWGIHKGRVWYNKRFATTRRVAAWVGDFLSGRPHALILIEPGNTAAHFHYLLRLAGNAPINRWDQAPNVYPNETGSGIVIVARGEGRNYAVSRGDLPEPPRLVGEIEDAKIYFVPRSSIPDAFRMAQVWGGKDGIHVQIIY